MSDKSRWTVEDWENANRWGMCEVSGEPRSPRVIEGALSARSFT